MELKAEKSISCVADISTQQVAVLEKRYTSIHSERHLTEEFRIIAKVQDNTASPLK